MKVAATISTAIMAGALACLGVGTAAADSTIQPTLDESGLSAQTYNSVTPAQRSALTRGELVPAYVDFSHPISLDSVRQLAVSIQSTPVIGFAFSQDGLYGEFYPSGQYTYDRFQTDFEAGYGTEPEITRAISITPASTARTGGSDSSTPQLDAPDVDSLSALAAGLPDFAAAPRTREGIFDTSIKSARANAEQRESTAALAFVNGGSDWPGSYVDIYAMNYGGSSAIGTWNQWQANSGRSPKNLPDDWGLEFDSYTKDDGAAGTRPACLTGWGFWQSSSVEYWSINAITGTDGDIQPYLDNATVSDSCQILDTTVGVGNPKNIGALPDGSSEIATNIQTAPGAFQHNAAGYYWQAVSHDCIGNAASWCMGLNTGRDLPMSNPAKSRPVFSATTNPIREFPGCYRWSVGNDPYRIDCLTGE